MRRLLCVLPVLAVLAACGGGGGDANPVSPTPTIPPQQFTITELRPGTGAEAVAGSRVTVEYALWLFSTTGTDNKGTLVDTSVGRAPYQFTLGTNAVIPGFDQGVTGMKVGGVRRLIVPPALGYGATGTPGVPPNANLVFEVELLSVQ
jgi:FKBP-type peptidyl-prolyl cis-trans isomerase FkpA